MSTDDIAQVEETVKQYLALKEQMDFLSERQSELKKRLTEAVDAHGEVDSKGHIVFQLENAKLVKQRKVSKGFNEDIAMKLLEEKDLLDECAPKVRQIDQDAVMASVYKGTLTEADIDTMFPPKVSYAFLING